jgi:hypothetical protein
MAVVVAVALAVVVAVALAVVVAVALAVALAMTAVCYQYFNKNAVVIADLRVPGVVAVVVAVAVAVVRRRGCARLPEGSRFAPGFRSQALMTRNP